MKPSVMIKSQPHTSWVCLTAAAMSFALFTGCPKDPGTGQVGSNPLLPPSVNDIPPLTNKAELGVSGSRSRSSSVWVEVEFGGEQKDAVELDEALPIVFWDGLVSLQEGENKLFFHARDVKMTETERVGPFTVVLDTIPPGPPSVKDDLPICTTEFNYTLEGSVEEGAKLRVDGQDVQTDDRNFAITVEVNSGDATTVVLTAVDEAGNESEPVEVVIAEGLPIPTLAEIPEVTNAISVTLTGEKDPGMGVLLRKEGQDEGDFIVEPNGDSAWEFELDLNEGENTFYIAGRNIDGEDSCSERGPFTIIQSSVCPPVITNRDDLPEFTGESEHTVELTRCEGVSTFVTIGDQSTDDAVLVQDASGGESISHDLDLAEGRNDIRYFNRDAEGLISPPANLTIEVDTIPPNAPVYNPEPADTTVEGSLDLRGDKDSNASICRRVNQEANCTEIIEINSSRSFRFDQEMGLGDNNICISSFDRAGNQSNETCAFIERLPNEGPTIVIQSPVNGAPINTAPFRVEAIVTDENGIDEVEICFDGRRDCQELDIQEGIDFYQRTITPGELENGDTYTVTVNATNRGGVPGTASVSVLYVVEGLLLSNTAPEEASERSRLAIDGEGRVHAVWSDACSQEFCEVAPNTLPADIFHRMFDGIAWSPITLLSDDVNDSESESPTLATDSNGNVHLVWADSGNIDGSGFDFDLVHRMFDINDDSWSGINVITGDSDLQDRAPSLAVGGDDSLHVVWERSGNSNFEIFYAAGQGNDWDDPLLVSGDAGSDRAGNAQVAADSTGVAYIVWQDDGDILDSGDDTDVYLKTFDGEFSPTVVVSDANLDGLSVGPRLAMSADDTLHIVWEDTSSIFGSGEDLDIFYRSYLLGEGFQGGYKLVSRGENDGDSTECSVTADPLDSGSVFVAWVDDGICDNCDNDYDVFYARSFGGIFGGEPVLVSAGGFNQTSEFPDLAFDEVGKVLHIVWEDDSTVDEDGQDRDIFYLGIQLEN